MPAIGLFIFFCEEKHASISRLILPSLPLFPNQSKALEVQDVLIGGDDKVFARLE